MKTTKQINELFELGVYGICAIAIVEIIKLLSTIESTFTKVVAMTITGIALLAYVISSLKER